MGKGVAAGGPEPTGLCWDQLGADNWGKHRGAALLLGVCVPVNGDSRVMSEGFPGTPLCRGSGLMLSPWLSVAVFLDPATAVVCSLLCQGAQEHPVGC